MSSRQRRTTATPLRFVINTENLNTNSVLEGAGKIEKKKRKHSMRAALKRSPSIEKIEKKKKSEEARNKADPQLREKIEVIKRRRSLVDDDVQAPPPPPPPPLAAPPPPPPITDYIIIPISKYEDIQKRRSIKFATLGFDLNEVKANLKKIDSPNIEN